VRRHGNDVLACAGEIFLFLYGNEMVVPTVMRHGTAVAAQWCGMATVVALFMPKNHF